MPKFTAKYTFREDQKTFEAGNSYDPALHGLTESDLKRFHDNGWVEVDGWDPPPERVIVRGVRLNPKKAVHQTPTGSP